MSYLPKLETNLSVAKRLFQLLDRYNNEQNYACIRDGVLYVQTAHDAPEQKFYKLIETSEQEFNEAWDNHNNKKE